MILKQRIEGFTRVGMFINHHFSNNLTAEIQLHQGLDKVIEMAHIYNGWFSPIFVKQAIINLGQMLTLESLTGFCAEKEAKSCKTVAVICAGNIPMVGFHDVMCVLLSGHKVLVKLSSDDNVLLPFFLKLLVHFEPEFEQYIYFAQDKLSAFDAVIATGSNNTAGHFKYYFGKYPHIIRKNRTSVAVLTGQETADELKLLGEDVFLYYGLGCRNVGSFLVPENYDFKLFFESILDFSYVIDNKKYGNNYDYHRAIYLLESQKFLDNNFVMIKENESIHSPVGTIHYKSYQTKQEVDQFLKTNDEHIQCIVGKGYVPFGYSQRPVITDFADNVNTWEFLLTL